MRVDSSVPEKVLFFCPPVIAAPACVHRFTVVAGHSSRKFALIAASGRDASELCQALDRQGDSRNSCNDSAIRAAAAAAAGCGHRNLCVLAPSPHSFLPRVAFEPSSNEQDPRELSPRPPPPVRACTRVVCLGHEPSSLKSLVPTQTCLGFGCGVCCCCCWCWCWCCCCMFLYVVRTGCYVVEDTNLGSTPALPFVHQRRCRALATPRPFVFSFNLFLRGRTGVAVAGMENLPDAVFLRGSDQRTTQALEAGIPSLSRPEVQAYIVR